MDPKCTQVPFAIGRVRKNPTSGQSEATLEDAEGISDNDEDENITVEVYYPSHGDPNDTWYRWDRVSDKLGQSGRKSSPWLKEIPRDSVIAINPETKTGLPYGRIQLTAKAKDTLAETPRFPWSYLAGKDNGLMPSHKVEEILLQKLECIVNKRSKAGQRASKKLETTLAQHRRTQATRDRVISKYPAPTADTVDTTTNYAEV
jgi:hypothetical protein